MSLTTLRLPTVLRAVAELADAVTQYRPDDHPTIIAAQSDPNGTEAPSTTDQFAWHDALDEIVDAANRVKRALGATGKLSGRILDKSPPPEWPNFATEFTDLDYPRPVRIGLRRLAFAAIALSGYGAMKQPPEEWRSLGMLQLGYGVAQVWPVLSATEREEVQGLLPTLRCHFGWPGQPTNDPPAWTGAAEIGINELSMTIDTTGGFYACDWHILQELSQTTVGAHPVEQASSPLPKGGTGGPKGSAPNDTDEDVLAGLPERARHAHIQYCQAVQTMREQEGVSASDVTDEAAYSHLKGEGVTLPSLETWTRYLREARNSLGQQKNKRRLRYDGRSAVSPEHFGDRGDG